MAASTLRDWVKPKLFEARPREIKHLMVKSPGKEDLDIALSADGSEHLLQEHPRGHEDQVRQRD